MENDLDICNTSNFLMKSFYEKSDFEPSPRLVIAPFSKNPYIYRMKLVESNLKIEVKRILPNWGIWGGLLTVVLFIPMIASAQYVENFFMDGFGTHRENHSFLTANNVGKIYELREDVKTGEKILMVSRYDHNGLPVYQKFFETSEEEPWEPNDRPFEQIDYLYIMENLFLMRQKTRLKLQEDNRDTVDVSMDYINFFQRSEKLMEDGTSLQYQYKNDNQLQTLVAVFPDSSIFKLEVNYLYGRAKEVNEMKKEPGGYLQVVRTAEYVYDQLNRPFMVTIMEGESVKKATIEYDSQGMPAKITWKINGEPSAISQFRVEERKPLIPEFIRE